MHLCVVFWYGALLVDGLFFWAPVRRIAAKKTTTRHRQNSVPMEQHGGGSEMLEGCFSSDGTGALVTVEGGEKKKKKKSFRHLLES